MGYPTAVGSKKYVWNKGKLTRIYDDVDENEGVSSEDIRFTYNVYGQRISKTYSYDPGEDYSGDFMTASTTTYTYDGRGRLIREYCTESYYESDGKTRELIYLYDEMGIVGVLYSLNGAALTTYYYRRNPQGDVTAIYTTTGTRIGEYAYDAFGNCTILYGSTNDLVKNNPILYRGYYYDKETNLYYLNARYYNPQWRRFVSPDSTSYLDPKSINGLNLYCYCYNDPVNYCDPTGHSVSLTTILIGIGIGVAIGLGAAAYVDYIDDDSINGSVGWKTYVGLATIGGALGFGISYFWPSIAPLLSAILSAGLPSLGATNMGGALVLSSAQGIALTVGGALVATGIGLMFASDHRPGNNRAQNKQIKDAIRKAGYNPNDPRIKDEINRMETFIRRHNLDYGWEKLLEFVTRWLGR